MIRRTPLASLTAAVLLSLVLAGPAAGQTRQTLAFWNFNDESLDIAYGQGQMKYDFSGITFYSGTDVNAPEESGADEPSRSLALTGGSGTSNDGTGGNNGRSLFILISTEGHRDLKISFAARRSGTGFTDNHLAYSTDDGGSFDDLDVSFQPEDDFTQHTLDLSGVEELNDQPQLIIRITFTGATHAQGNNRLDNLHFTARPR